MISPEGIEFACDELADFIDEAKGELDVDEALTKHVDTICNQDKDIDPVLFRKAFLEVFEEVYLCDPATFAENCVWANEIEPIDTGLDDLGSGDVLDGDVVSLDDLDEIL